MDKHRNSQQESVTSLSKGLASWQVYALHCANSKLHGKAQRVASHLAMRHSKDFGYAFPPITEIMTACNLSRTSVDRAIAEIKESGEWLVVTGRGGLRGRAWVSNRYYPSALLVGTQDAALTAESTAEPDAYWESIFADEAVSFSDAPTEDDIAVVEEEEPISLETLAEEPLAADVVKREEPRPRVAKREAANLTWYEEVIRDCFEAYDQKLFAGYLRTITPKTRSAIASLCEAIRDSGADLRLTLEEALDRTNSISQPAAWLVAYGLKTPRKIPTAASAPFAMSEDAAAHAEFMMHGNFEDIDYGVTGQEF